MVNFENVDKIVFHNDGNAEHWWIMDNFAYTPIPEATTMIAGALLRLPLGISTVRFLRKQRVA